MGNKNEKNIVEPAKILASATHGITRAIETNNGDVDRIFGEAAITMNDIDDPLKEINLIQFCELFEQAAKQTGNDNFGLHFGDLFQPKHLGAIGYAAIASPTLSAALRNMIKYFPAHQGKSHFSLIQNVDLLWLNYTIADERIVNRRQDAELSLGMFINVFRHALGEKWKPLEVRFEHSAPDGASEHSKIFDAPVGFGRRTNAFAFRRKDLDAIMPNQDPYLFSIIEPILKDRCKAEENIQDFATLVRNQIKLHLGEVAPTPSDIAKMLGMVDNSFQKRMKQNNLTFNAVLRAAREELAIHYVKNPDISMTEVAFRLGYSELSAFSRAFRNWTGMTPQRYRRMHAVI